MSEDIQETDNVRMFQFLEQFDFSERGPVYTVTSLLPRSQLYLQMFNPNKIPRVSESREQEANGL